MKTYYVTYQAKDNKGQIGMGWAEIRRQNPIETVDAVLIIANDIKKSKKYKSVTVMDWKLMKS